MIYLIIYTVKSGDTLTSIAQNYNITPESLVQINGIPNANNLVVGQNIVIPSISNNILGDIAVNGYCYTYIDKTLLYEALPFLTYLTIFTYGFTEDGELIVPDDTKLIQIAKNYGVAPIMLISTLTESGTFSSELASNMFNNINAQNTLINNILENVKAKNYYGVDIDFEFVPANDKDAFVNFIKKLKETLNAEGFKLFISLAPKTSATQSGLLYESHDYNQLGKNADKAILMTYEWGYTYAYIRYIL